MGTCIAPITRKQASDIIEYLDKINDRQIKIERDVTDVRRMLEESKMWVEHDEIYNESFIKVNILFIIFL